MEGCTTFLLDWLIEGKGGYLETNPSTSPEHMFVTPSGKQASVSYSSTMDISIIREVFNAVVSAAEVKLLSLLKNLIMKLSIFIGLISFFSFSFFFFFGKQVLGKNEDSLIAKVREAQPRLPPVRIARDGSVMEWVRV